MRRFSIKELSGMGISVTEFIRRSGLSFQTLKKIDAGDTSVRAMNIGKALRTLEEFKAEQSLRMSPRNAGTAS